MFGGLVVALTLLWPYLGSTTGQSLKIEKTSAENTDVLTMENATIHSLDKNKRPVQIVAEKATPRNQNLDRVGLSAPKAKVDLADGRTFNIESDTGDYIQDQNKLVLQGDVKFNNELGHSIRSESASIALDTNDVTTNTPVSGTSSQGTFQADGLIYEQNGQRIVLKGKSKLVFNMKQINKDNAASDSTLKNVDDQDNTASKSQ